MRIPKVEVEKRRQVQARVYLSEFTELQALAAANGVPVARVVHYAIECLLEAARAADPAVLRSGIVERDEGVLPADALGQVADALGFAPSEREADVEALPVATSDVSGAQTEAMPGE